jgi:multidrug efflux system membrane fusion protein
MKRLLTAVLLVALLGFGYYFRGLVFDKGTVAGPARPAASQPVVADVAIEMPAPILVTAIGSAQSIATVMIKSRMDGQIAQVHFKEGQEVREGDLLFTLDDRALRAQLAQIEAALERDRASLQRAKMEVTRQSGLATRGVASAQKFEDVETSVAVLEATVRAAEAAVENTRVSLSYATILAPINGRTGSVALKKGNLVKATELSSSSPLVTITQLRPIYVTFTVPERHLAELRAAAAEGSMHVLATIPSQPKTPITGALVFIDNQVDVATGSITLKAEFANEDTRLWPGQFVNVTLRLTTRGGAVVVPNQAVQTGQDGTFIYVVKDDRSVEVRPVTTGPRVDLDLVIDKGLAAGETVVTEGQLRLQPGSRIQTKEGRGGAFRGKGGDGGKGDGGKGGDGGGEFKGRGKGGEGFKGRGDGKGRGDFKGGEVKSGQ